MLNVLILEDNEFLPLTINSLKANMPNVAYNVVDKGSSRLQTALNNTKEPTLVVKSGLVLQVKEKDISYDKIKRYPICVSREAVYSDNPQWHHNYKDIKSPLTKGTMDLSIFIINPELWLHIPKKDSGIWDGMKKLFMPRHMNHKTDVLMNTCISSYAAFQFGLLGEYASVFNYVPLLAQGKATPIETYAYCFDKFLPFTDGLDPTDKDKVERIGNLTKERIGKMRYDMYKMQEEL